MTFIEDKIRMVILNLRKTLVSERIEVKDITIARAGYKTENKPPVDLVWESYTSGTPFHMPTDSHAWLHFTVNVPECTEDEAMFLGFTTSKEEQWAATNPQCTVYVDSETCSQSFDTNHTELLISSGMHDIYIYLYAGKFESYLYLTPQIIRKNKLINKLHYDIYVPWEAMRALEKDSYEYNTICNALDKACLLLDFRGMPDEAFIESVKKADKFLEEEFYGKVCGKDTSSEVAYIGHTHIDVAWLWTLAQTVEKAQRSFSTAIKLMEQYPDYVFMSSQPQLYEYVKNTDPELYEKIKKRVSEGRWETEGAMWLESDTNLVSGESLIRQIMYGKKFMMDEFGSNNHILWLPDVFGYSGALPQILKKCGVDTFFTTKIGWNETNKFPHDNFIWQGIDGSEIFAILSDRYVRPLTAPDTLDATKKHVTKKYSDIQISTYGYGDGGGGPTFEMLETYDRLKRGLPGFPKVTMRKASDTIKLIRDQFDKNAKELRFAPKWSGELYLEFHRGTYTTMAANKKNNRLSEYAFQDAETVSAAAKLLTGAAYPKETLDEGWHTILKNQFHDIIPGSSIEAVYIDSDREYAEVLESGKQMFESAIANISADIKTDGGILVYNPTSFARDGIVELDGKEYFAHNVPAHGYTVIDAADTKQANVFANEKVLENDFIKVIFNDKYHIVSIYDKKACREVIEENKEANVLEVFEDYPRDYDAWEITEYYKQKMWVADDVTAVQVIENPLRSGITIKRRYRNSVICQEVTLGAHSARLDFKTEIDWNEDHVLLKAAFPFDIRANNATYEIQFGHLERPTHRNTPWDEAKFEVCAHKWADISESDYGVAILNDCKYGYNCEENVMKISLLKAPTDPNPNADRCHHSFTYSVYPHTGVVATSDTVKEAYYLNKPLKAYKIDANPNGSLESTFSFVSSDKKNAVIDTVKLSENGEGYVVRVYDCAGTKTYPTLTFGFEIEKAYECDMLENVIGEIPVNANTVDFKLSNFEVKTIFVKAKR